MVGTHTYAHVLYIRTYIMYYIYSMYVQNELLHVCKMCIFSDHVLVSSEVIELMTSHDSQSCS